MYEPLLSSLLRKLAREHPSDNADPWPAIHDRIQLRRSSHSPAPTSKRSGRQGLRVPRLVTVAGAVAAAVVLGISGVGVLQPWSHPTPANAAEVLTSLRDEALSSPAMIVGASSELPCPLVTQPSDAGFGMGVRVGPGPSGAGGPQMFYMGGSGPVGPGPSGAGGPQMFYMGAPGASGPVGPGPDGQDTFYLQTGPNTGGPPPGDLPNPSEMSDRLGQALGISGDRVRDAMRQTISADLPAVDPLARIATQLGVTRDQVRDAFSDPACPGRVMIRRNADANDLAGPAAKLGVATDQLIAAMDAAAPPVHANVDDVINRLAQNLGVSPDRLRAALTEVEGPNHLYFAFPTTPGVPPALGPAPQP